MCRRCDGERTLDITYAHDEKRYVRYTLIVCSCSGVRHTEFEGPLPGEHSITPEEAHILFEKGYVLYHAGFELPEADAQKLKDLAPKS